MKIRVKTTVTYPMLGTGHLAENKIVDLAKVNRAITGPECYAVHGGKQVLYRFNQMAKSLGTAINPNYVNVVTTFNVVGKSSTKVGQKFRMSSFIDKGKIDFDKLGPKLADAFHSAIIYFAGRV